MFEKKRSISKVAQNILQKRYYSPGEKSWEDIANRVIEWVIPDAPEERKKLNKGNDCKYVFCTKLLPV